MELDKRYEEVLNLLVNSDMSHDIHELCSYCFCAGKESTFDNDKYEGKILHLISLFLDKHRRECIK